MVYRATIKGRKAGAWALAGTIACLALATEATAAEITEDQPEVAQAAGTSDETEAKPPVAIDGSIEFQYDNAYKATDPDAVRSEGYITFEPEITWNITDSFRLFGGLVSEPVLDPLPGMSRFLKDDGVYAKQIYAEMSIGAADISLGKLDPTFGWAFDAAPGLYGGDYAGDYELLGELGVRANVTLSEEALAAPAGIEDTGGDTGPTVKQVMSVALFTADTSILSESALTNRGRLNLSDGGTGNTGKPDSFALAYTYETLDGEDAVAGPSVQLAVRRLAAGEGDLFAEWGMLASYQDKLTLQEDLTLTTLAEAAYFVHESGGEQDGTFVTFGGELASGPWFLSAAYSLRDLQNDGLAADNLLTASLGRTFETDALGEFRSDIGFRYAEDAGESSQTFGIRFQKEFSSEF